LTVQAKQAVLKQKTRIGLQLFKTEVTAVHQTSLLNPSVGSIKNVCDDVKIATMAIADASFRLNQQAHQ
jgi:hypothetical protein